jgi:hypothetical protein
VAATSASESKSRLNMVTSRQARRPALAACGADYSS